MKGILEFSLPEEEKEFLIAANGWKYKLVISELFDWINHSQDYGSREKSLEDFRKAIVDRLDENGVEL